MAIEMPARAHVITGGFPPGQPAGHDHDYARLRLLNFLAERDIQASVANDFVDVERWLPISRLLISYVAGPYPGPDQNLAIRKWIEAGGHWLGLHGTSGGRAVSAAACIFKQLCSATAASGAKSRARIAVRAAARSGG